MPMLYSNVMAQDSLRVSLITCDAGAEIYELCGHAALRINHGGNNDYVVNYGLFDFNSPNFVYRFVKGETDYLVGAHPTKLFLDTYAADGRGVREYPLNLTQEQALKLEALLWENMRPANRNYRYNYVKDNCATRPLTMIERAIGDSITFAKVPQQTEGWSFRDEMKWYHRNYPWYQLGIDIALGSGIDYPITAREKGFAPLMLDSILPHATIVGPMGDTISLTGTADTLVSGTPGGAAAGATPWYLTPTFIFWILFVAVLAISVHDIWKRHESRWLDTVLYTAFGLAGTLVAFLVLISEHEATSPNWLIIGLNPFCFIGAILPWIKKLHRLLYYYHTVNFGILFIAICAWSFTGQVFNPALWPLLLIDMVRSDTYRLIWKCRQTNTNISNQD